MSALSSTDSNDEINLKLRVFAGPNGSGKINKYRVSLRKMKGGHDVPFDKIESRYYRSLDLMYDACQLCYQAFFFDNSENDKPFIMFAHFKKVSSEKKWDPLIEREIPNWFRVYYSQRVLKQK